MKCLYSNSFIKLDSFHDQRIEVTFSESIQGFSTKGIYIQQKAMFIISYIFIRRLQLKKVVVTVSRKFCLLQRYRFSRKLFLLCICKVIFLRVIFEDIYQNLLYSYSFTFTRNSFIYLFTYLFIYLICLFILCNYQIFTRNIFIKNLTDYISEKVEKRLEENMIKPVKLLKGSVIYKFV